MKTSTCISFIAAFLLNFYSAAAYEERNIIMSELDGTDLVSLHMTDGNWFPYPEYADREAWAELFGNSAEKVVREAEKYEDYAWTVIPASAYLEYERSGDRQVMEKPYEMNRRVLNMFALAELAEGKGRFLDRISDGLWAGAQMPSWVLSAHLPRQASGRSIPEGRQEVIDLGSAGYAASMSIICHLFENYIDQAVLSAVKTAVREKILKPYLDPSCRDANWWMAENPKPGQIINNWNPWCNSNVLLCFLLMEDDNDVLADAVRLSAVSVDRFLNYVKGDGACEEGPAYWGHAAGKLYDYLRILCDASGVTCLDNSLVRRMGEYISRSYIGNGMVVNFADASAVFTPDIPLVYRYGYDCGSREMMDFALYLLYNPVSGTFKYPQPPLGNDIWRSLETLRHMGKMCHEIDSLNVLCNSVSGRSGLYLSAGRPDAAVVPASVRASLRADVPQCTWYPETEFAYMRNGNGWFLAAKGGFNNESHNHNDAGTFILCIDGVPVFVDAGVGTYTKKTFSHERYDIWSMQSGWHNLPMINGTSQIFGQEFKASDVKCSTSRLSFSAELSGAYSDAASCRSWVRSYDMGEKDLKISDRFVLSGRIVADTVNFLVQGKVYLPGEDIVAGAGTSVKTVSAASGAHVTRHGSLPEVPDGQVVIVNGDIAVSLSYPLSLLPSVKEMSLTDPRMSNVWGPVLRRISFASASDAPAKGHYDFVVRQI